MIRLKETIFFAQAGGQESDAGRIAEYPVLKASKEGLEISYLLPAEHRLQAGDQVQVAIDWQRRYRLMRLHFAAELILELVGRELPGSEKIGAHISPEKARIDFLWPQNISSLFGRLGSQAQALIEQNLAISSGFSDPVEQRRHWEIPGFARVACGGTHLKRTGEVGPLRLKRKNIGKGKERIEIYLDD